MPTEHLGSRPTSAGGAPDSRVERQGWDFVLLALTLVMIALCVPLAQGYVHMDRSPPFDTSDHIWSALAMLGPIALTCGAAYQAATWIMRKGVTPRGRIVWSVLLSVAFLGSGAGFLLAFTHAWVNAAAKYGIH